MFKNSITNELNSIIETINNNTINDNLDNDINDNIVANDNLNNKESDSDSSNDSDVFSNLLTEQIFNIEEYLTTIIEMTKELNIAI